MTLNKAFCIPVISFLLMACQEHNGYQSLSGEAQGTYFSIKYKRGDLDAEVAIDSIFRKMDQQFSTYIPKSVISLFNHSQSGVNVDGEFMDLWEKCWEINIESDGFFDPTIAPVLDVYKSQKSTLDSNEIQEKLSFTGLPLISFEDGRLRKKIPQVSIDLNGIAQGYTVDLIARYFEQHGITDYLVEVGGEVKAKGRNHHGRIWTVGIDKPVSGERGSPIAKVEVSNRAVATSGNYRKFREVNGQQIGHIIDPKSGFPARSDLLSVSVFSNECYRADALATAFMNMNSKEAIQMSLSMKDVEVILVSISERDTLIYWSPGLEKYRVD